MAQDYNGMSEDVAVHNTTSSFQETGSYEEKRGALTVRRINLHCEFSLLRSLEMNSIATKDGVEIFYKDWGKGQPIVFSHGWPLWRQGMMGGAKAHYDGIVAFSQTDFTEDLKKITVPVLVMHGDDDQIVPYADSGPLSAKLLKNSTLKTYKGFPHGMPRLDVGWPIRARSRLGGQECMAHRLVHC
jgi:homoserine acetyltransferase